MTLALLTNKQIIAELAERVDTLRAKNGIQVSALEAAGVSASTYARFQRGTSIGLDKLLIILREVGNLEDIDKLCRVVTLDPIAVVEKKTSRRKRVNKPMGSSTSSDADDDSDFTWGEDA